MRTGFVHAFINKPLTTYYLYHGTWMPCNVGPEPQPFYQEPMIKPAPVWELIFNAWNNVLQIFKVDYLLQSFPPSPQNDTCVVKFPDGKKRHYFCVAEIWDGTFPIGWSADFSGITPCSVYSRGGTWDYFYKAYVADIWAEKDWLVWIYQWVPNSHFMIWRSSTGEMPSYYPVPIEEYHS